MKHQPSTPNFAFAEPDLIHSDPADRLRAEVEGLHRFIQQQQAEIRYLKRELFGAKSEKRRQLTEEQLEIADLPGPLPKAPPKPDAPNNKGDKKPRGRGKKERNGNEVNLTGLRFELSVPVREIIIEAEELKGENADQYELVGHKETSRVAQKTSAYEVVITKRQIVKRKGSSQLITAPLPNLVFDSSIADVSFAVGLLTDKFQYHLPLYRQHLRLTAAGIHLSRATLTNIVKRAIELLRPIVVAQLNNVLQSAVLAMDETPIKVSREPGAGSQPGKMKQAYFWPIYGEQDEVVFTFSQSRAMAHIQRLLDHVWQGTLLTDGYAAYSSYENKSEQVVNAQCWVHMRRQLLKAEPEEKQAVSKALDLISELYRHEKVIAQQDLTGEQKLAYRGEHSKPVVDALFEYLDEQQVRPDLLPDDTWTKSILYATKRQRQLRVFLEKPCVAMDTNHLEREIRPIPMGKKNWLFCWTELGAEHLGIIQSLISTCKLHDINPSVYLTDVLQRVGQHPAKQVIELTPRVWKQTFAANPLASALA